MVQAFSVHYPSWSLTVSRQPQLLLHATAAIEFQDSPDYGRGQDHLSAFVQEGDVVVYQTGTWYVDGVEVGDGGETRFEMAQLSNLQVVWTHNCEHGVLRGFQVLPISDTKLQLTTPLVDVEFGPEQLIAKVPVEWNNDNETIGVSMEPMNNDLWLQHGMVEE